MQDISQAFLYARRDEDKPVFIRIPPGMKEFYQGSGDLSKSLRKCLCQVVRSVYGLKEAPRLWQEEFTKACVDDIGMTMHSNDPLVFYTRPHPTYPD